MLLVVGAKAAIVGASIKSWSIELFWEVARFQKIPAFFVIIDVRCNQIPLNAMFRAMFGHVNLIVLEDHLGLNPPQTMIAKA